MNEFGIKLLIIISLISSVHVYGMADGKHEKLLLGKWSTDELDSEWGKCIHMLEFKKNGILRERVFFTEENESILSEGWYEFTDVNKLTLHIEEYSNVDKSYKEKESRDIDVLIDLNNDSLRVVYANNGEEYLFKRMRTENGSDI